MRLIDVRSVSQRVRLIQGLLAAVGLLWSTSSVHGSDLYSRISIGATFVESAGEGRAVVMPAASASGSEVQTPVVPASEPEMQWAGTWVSSPQSGEVIAFRLFDDGRFTLAVAKAGKGKTSQGQFTRLGNRLVLVGQDQVTITAAFEVRSADQIALRFSGGGATEFRRVP
jgi:hypothetical protein